jgi:flagellar hook-length control protein FliK
LRSASTSESKRAESPQQASGSSASDRSTGKTESAKSDAVAPDPTGEAQGPNGKGKEKSVSLTDLLAALQPVVNQSLAGLLAGSEGETGLSEQVNGLLSGDLLAGGQLNMDVLSQYPGLSPILMQLIESGVFEASNGSNPAQALTNLLQSLQIQQNGTGGTTLETLAQSLAGMGGEANAAGAGLSQEQIASILATVGQTQAEGTGAAQAGANGSTQTGSVAFVLPEMDPAATGDATQVEAGVGSKVSVASGSLTDAQAVAVQPAVVAESSGVFGVQADVPVTKASEVPAIQQIVKAVQLISEQGESEVRLRLQPPELGHLLIQLKVGNGDVSVRMLAETVQAQHVLREHLAELKSAFADQGFQVNDLDVALGADMSAFDAPQRGLDAWENDQSQNQSNTPVAGEVNEPSSAPVRSRSPDGSWTVDYRA